MNKHYNKNIFSNQLSNHFFINEPKVYTELDNELLKSFYFSNIEKEFFGSSLAPDFSTKKTPKLRKFSKRKRQKKQKLIKAKYELVSSQNSILEDIIPDAIRKKIEESQNTERQDIIESICEIEPGVFSISITPLHPDDLDALEPKPQQPRSEEYVPYLDDEFNAFIFPQSDLEEKEVSLGNDYKQLYLQKSYELIEPVKLEELNIAITITANNIFIHGRNLKTNMLVFYASSGTKRIITSKKKLKHDFAHFLIIFFRQLLKKDTSLLFGEYDLVTYTIKAPHSMKKTIIEIIGKEMAMSENFFIHSKAHIIETPYLKAFNGCKGPKKIRKKRKYNRLYK